MTKLTSKHGMSSITNYNESVLVPRGDWFSGDQFPKSDVFGFSESMCKNTARDASTIVKNSLDYSLQSRAKIFLSIIPQNAWFYSRSEI